MILGSVIAWFCAAGTSLEGADVLGGGTLTPADEDVPPDVTLVGGEGEQQEGLQVHALHQQPVEVSQDRVLEEGDGCFAVHLRGLGGEKLSGAGWEADPIPRIQGTAGLPSACLRRPVVPF